MTVLPFWLAKIVAFLTGNREMKFGVKLVEYYERVGEAGDPSEANRLLGAPKITLKGWLEKLRKSLV